MHSFFPTARVSSHMHMILNAGPIMHICKMINRVQVHLKDSLPYCICIQNKFKPDQLFYSPYLSALGM